MCLCDCCTIHDCACLYKCSTYSFYSTRKQASEDALAQSAEASGRVVSPQAHMSDPFLPGKGSLSWATTTPPHPPTPLSTHFSASLPSPRPPPPLPPAPPAPARPRSGPPPRGSRLRCHCQGPGSTLRSIQAEPSQPSTLNLEP